MIVNTIMMIWMDNFWCTSGKSTVSSLMYTIDNKAHDWGECCNRQKFLLLYVHFSKSIHKNTCASFISIFTIVLNQIRLLFHFLLYFVIWILNLTIMLLYGYFSCIYLTDMPHQYKKATKLHKYIIFNCISQTIHFNCNQLEHFGLNYTKYNNKPKTTVNVL